MILSKKNDDDIQNTKRTEGRQTDVYTVGRNCITYEIVDLRLSYFLSYPWPMMLHIRITTKCPSLYLVACSASASFDLNPFGVRNRDSPPDRQR